MRRSRPWLIAIASLVALTFSGVGHAADASLYDWSNYERDFCRPCDEPEKLKAFETTLLQIIKKSDEAGRKPPPGVVAEYGYMLYERSEFDTAIDYFEREAREWPESQVLMKRMIARAREGGGS